MTQSRSASRFPSGSRAAPDTRFSPAMRAWMGFSMRCWPRFDSRHGAPQVGVLCLLFTLLASPGVAAQSGNQSGNQSGTEGGSEPGFRVLEAHSTLREGVHRVDAKIDFRFSDEAIEAMENGVAITVSIQMQVRRVRALIDETVAEVRARYRIQTHSLSRRYVVTNLSTDESKTFHTYQAMLGSLGDVENFPLLDDRVLEHGQRYLVRVRATLDIESLPAPMRPLAYLSSSWRLSSDWSTWRLQR